jgi:hypothetical protein
MLLANRPWIVILHHVAVMLYQIAVLTPIIQRHGAEFPDKIYTIIVPCRPNFLSHLVATTGFSVRWL